MRSCADERRSAPVSNQSSSTRPGGGDGKHAAFGGTYWLLIDNSPAESQGGLGQVKWRWYANCQGIWFAGVAGSRCPAGPNQNHISSNSGKYILLT